MTKMEIIHKVNSGSGYRFSKILIFAWILNCGINSFNPYSNPVR